jgi:PAS domain S-box-containing protein
VEQRRFFPPIEKKSARLNITVMSELENPEPDDDAMSRDALLDEVRALRMRVQEQAQTAFVLTEKLRRREAEHRDFLDNMVDTYYRTDRQGRITFVSRSVVNLLGYEVDEILGRHLSTLYVYPEARTQLIAQLNENDGRIIAYEAPLRRKDNGVVWVATNAHYIYDAAGETLGVEGAARDVIDRRNAQRALRESEFLVRSIIDNAPTPISLKALSGEYLLVNKAFARQRGISPSEMIGATAYDSASGHHADAATKHHLKVIKRLETITEERNVVMEDGAPYQELITKFPVFDSEGTLTSVGSVSIDISELKQIQSVLENSETRFRDFAQSTSDSFWEMDENLRFTDVTSMQDRVYAKRADIIGKTRWEAANGDAENGSLWIEHRKDLEQHKAFRRFEYWTIDGNGKDRCISVSGVPVFDSKGEFTGFRGGTFDITNLSVRPKSS